MRKLFYCCVLVLVVASMTTTHADGAIEWTKGPSSPVITESDDATRFDSGYVCEPRVVYDSDTNKYFMFYTGATDEYRIRREMIGLATAPSLNGPWTKFDGLGDRGSLFEPGLPGDYDYNRNWGQGTIRKKGPNSWEMWTVGDSEASGGHKGRLGYATSTDGYHWTKQPGSGYGGSIYEDFTVSPTGIGQFAVLKEDNTYHAWYSGLGLPRAEGIIKYTTSQNGIDWTTPIPVLTGANANDLENVVKIDDTYYMSITRTDEDYSYSGVTLYSSTDKTSWAKLSEAGIYPSSGSWDSERVYYSFLFPASTSQWYLFYTGADVADDSQAKIGYAYTSVPEPGTLSLLGTGLLMLIGAFGYTRTRMSMK